MIRSELEKGCRIGFFGLGISNFSLLNYLPLNKCSITLRSDSEINWSEIPCGARVERIFCGKSSCDSINEDIIIFSPSVRRERKELDDAKGRGVIFTSDSELFFDEVSSPVFAITGSDGKSTTATLTSMLLSSGGVENIIVGNIGIPMLPYLNQNSTFVTELSSFMLQYTRVKARRGCITNITPNHLNWHESFEEYKKTKISLLKNTEEYIIPESLADVKNAFAIIGEESDYKELKKRYKAELYLTCENNCICRNGRSLLPLSEVGRKEGYNIKNLMLAIAMCDGYVDKEGIRTVAKGFGGLRHRCEAVARIDGVDCYDSSIDSTPKRTANTLTSLGRRSVVILGGRSKGLDYTELRTPLKLYAYKTIITGENSKEIYDAVSHHTDAEVIGDFEGAVLQGLSYARDCGTLLLSPASTSFDLFKNYAERGDRFKEILLKKRDKDNNYLQKYIESRKK